MTELDTQKLSVFGVRIVDLTFDEALGAMLSALRSRPSSSDGDVTERRARSIYFVNAHTLNLAHQDPSFRDVLNRADFVFGDGTGVRWACRVLHGVALKDNVNGTDLVPRIFAAGRDQGLSYYLLGNTEQHIERAAEYARRTFTGWKQAGYHHGYLDDKLSRQVVERINTSGAHMLLVGMGNPIQEKWLDRHIHALTVPICLGIGGLLDYWAGNIERAPYWLRRLGHEWLYILVQQPNKSSRYLFGNPRFLARMVKSKVLGSDRRRSMDLVEHRSTGSPSDG